MPLAYHQWVGAQIGWLSWIVTYHQINLVWFRGIGSVINMSILSGFEKQLIQNWWGTIVGRIQDT